MIALALIDGEHYPPVVRDALNALPYEFACCVNVGGGEKLRSPAEDGEALYGVPLAASIERGVETYSPEIVVDLSDEPVLGPRERLAAASRVLALGLPYAGPDFRFDPPALEAFPLPSLSVIGTGKRVGKTALAIQLARACARHLDIVVVAMGRGGPPEPELRETPPSVEDLLELARSGRHAASDYLEDALLGEIVSVGARRCGGGLAGAVGYSNVAQAAEMALERRPDLVVFEGSGAALPPIASDRRVLVVSAHQDVELACGYLNAYRILVSDLLVLSFAEPGKRLDQLRRAIAELRPDLPVIATAMRPRPLAPVAGKKVALFTTAPKVALRPLGEQFERVHGAEVVHVSGNLALRSELTAELAQVDAELFLVELKAAAVDVVIEEAVARGCEVGVIDNELVPLAGEAELEPALLELAQQARAKEPVG
ncbi:MAG: 2,3-diphosphoglycerate synthetase [Gaiellaceae bacterium]|jgi:cyclic 2,3-diphosphoglycerate synthetase